MVGKSYFNENSVVCLDLDLDFGLRLRVCQYFPIEVFDTGFLYILACLKGLYLTIRNYLSMLTLLYDALDIIKIKFGLKTNRSVTSQLQDEPQP